MYLVNVMKSKDHLQKLLSGLPFPDVFVWLGLVIVVSVITGLAAGIVQYEIFKDSFEVTVEEMSQTKLPSGIELPIMEASGRSQNQCC